MWSKLKTLMLIALIYLMSVLVFTDTGGKTNSEIVEREAWLKKKKKKKKKKRRKKGG